jgi:hypothetical protein
MAFSSANAKKIQKYYIQHNTKNESFVQMHFLLKAKGIENNDFFLRVYNKHLRKIDPYDADLTEEEQEAIFLECATNKYYFIREVFRLPENGTSLEIGGGIPFQLHRSNLAQLWASDLNLSTYCIAPRQTK